MTPFVPDDFVPPVTFEHSAFRLVPLGPEHNQADFDAWTSSKDHIRRTPGFESRNWPSEMSAEENLSELSGHARDFAARQGFTYTVVGTDGQTIGCVYLYPSGEEGTDVEVRSWVRADRAALDVVLHDAVEGWLADAWPFATVAYAPRA